MSKSNIVFQMEYRMPSNKKGGISKWIGYVSQKNKVDSSSIDKNNMFGDYVLNNDKDYYTFENDEVFLWDKNGDLSKKDAELNIKDMDTKGMFWRGFLSFPLEFSLENGLVTKQDYYSLTINIMPRLILDMGLDINNTEWMCALHLDTPKHPHIHFSIYEKSETKTSPKYDKSIIYRFKSYVANYLINNEEFYKLRNDSFANITGTITSKELSKIKSQRLFSDKYRRDLNKMLNNLYDKLPSKGRLQYNSKSMAPYRNELNKIIEYILLHDSVKYDYANYLRLLEKHQKELNEIYGTSKSIDKDKYYNDQLNRLYTKVGNEILQNFKRYQSLDYMEKEKEFLRKHIHELNFRSRRDYVKEETRKSIAKDLYKICRMAGLNDSEAKKVFQRWVNRSKYDMDIDSLLSSYKDMDVSMSTTEYYKSLNRLGYSYDRLSKIKNKNFYREISYKRFINKAVDHLMYELEREENAIVNDIKYDLGELI